MERSGGVCSATFGWCVRPGHSPGWPDVAVVRVLQGRDARSVRALIRRVQERGFHDVAIVDMAEPAVSEADLSLLRLQWPVTVVQSMV